MTLVVAAYNMHGIALSTESYAALGTRVEGDTPATPDGARVIREVAIGACETVEKLFLLSNRFAVVVGGNVVNGARSVLGDLLANTAGVPETTRKLAVLLTQRCHHSQREVVFVIAGVDPTGELVLASVTPVFMNMTVINQPIMGQPSVGCFVGGLGKEIADRLLNGAGRIRYESFSLQDLVDFSRHVVHTCCEHRRYEANERDIGGEIETALVTREGARWVARRQLVAKPTGAPRIEV